MYSASKALRWGICGSGNISNDFCAAIGTLPKQHHQVTSIAARSKLRAEEFATKFNIPNSFDNYDELFRSDNVDVVYIGVINASHKQLILGALTAKKPVLCEKPICPSSADVTEVMEAAKKAGVFVMEGYWTRFFPTTEKVASLLKSGDLGSVKMLSASFCRIMEESAMMLENNGGCTLTIGYYLYALSCMLFGKEIPENIQANAVLDKDGVDQSTTVRLQYKNGGVAQLYCTSRYHGSCEAGIEGTAGSVKIKYPFWAPTDLTLPNGTELNCPPDQDWLKIGPCNYDNPWGMRFEADHVRQCLIEGLQQSPVWTLEHALAVAEISEEILRQVGYGKSTVN